MSSQNIPLFYGWFFDEIVADGLKKITDDYLARLYGNVEKVNIFLKNMSTMTGIEDSLQYYTKPVDPNTGKYDQFFHITAFYCGTNDCTNYSSRVAQYVNQIFITHLVGVFFTPRTYGVRVNLTSIQKEIFEIGESSQGIEDSYFILNDNEEPCVSQLLDGIKFCPQDDNNFHPTDTRAHITLGCAPNISAVTTGLDLIEILKWETEPSQFCVQIQADYGNLIQMGDDCNIFVYYLKEKIVANSTFGIYYSNATRKESVQWCTTLIFFVLLLILSK